MTPILVFSTCPSTEVAEKIAAALIEDRLAACVHVSSAVTSFYRWEGKIQREPEVQLVIKTQESRFDDLCQKIRQLHPYEIPEILSIPIVSGLEAYLAWLNQETR